MRSLDSKSTQRISGGLSCSEALIQEAIYLDIDDITQFCTIDQAKTYSLAMIDLVYTIGVDNMTIEKEIELIQSLKL